MPVEQDNRVWHTYGHDCFGEGHLEAFAFGWVDENAHWYQRREDYAPGYPNPDGTFWPQRARNKPQTGNDLLDSTPRRPSESLTKVR